MRRTEPVPMAYAAWQKTLQHGAAHFHQTLTDAQLRLFYRHAELLRKWNHTTNLTSIRDPQDVAVKHFIDSFGPAPYIAPMRRVLDAGSGGGFPGLPLKVCCPAIDLTMVDAVRKKSSFLQCLIRELGMQNARAWHARVEDLGIRKPTPRFDTIVCRAVTDLAFIVRNLSPLLSEDGLIAVWKGRFPDREIQEVLPLLESSPHDLALSVHSYTLPFSGDARTLVIMSAAGREFASTEVSR